MARSRALLLLLFINRIEDIISALLPVPFSSRYLFTLPSGLASLGLRDGGADKILRLGCSLLFLRKILRNFIFFEYLYLISLRIKDLRDAVIHVEHWLQIYIEVNNPALLANIYLALRIVSYILALLGESRYHVLD